MKEKEPAGMELSESLRTLKVSLASGARFRTSKSQNFARETQIEEDLVESYAARKEMELSPME
jgi:hypothetical protein